MNRCVANSIVFALLLLITSSAVYARTDYCVGTVAELQSAINAAESDGDSSVITLRPGSYVLPTDFNYSQSLLISEGALTLRGGAIGSNCIGTVPGVEGTRIAGLFALTFLQRRGEITIQDITFADVDVRITKLALATDAVRVQRVLMLSALLVVNAPSSDVIVRESVFKNGADLFGVPDFGLLINAIQSNASDPEGNVQLINISVLDALAQVRGTNRLTPVRVSNSIFVRTGAELESSANLIVRNSRSNSIQMLAGATLTASNVITAAPALNSRYQPLSTSPMLDRGISAVFDGLPLVDVYGEARVVGASVDIGAAESPSDSNGIVVVDTTASSGDGSLAAAVAFANADSAPNTIRFAIPGSSCPKRIVRTSALTINDGLVIDGYSQPGSVRPSSGPVFNGEPCILLDGNNGTHHGIVTGSALAANNESLAIRGIAFEDFDNALFLSEGGDHVVQGNQFGGSIGSSSTVMAGNTRAILIGGAGLSLIGGTDPSQGNLIVGSSSSGIQISSDDNLVVGNQIGFDGSGIASSAATNARGININGRGNRILSNRIRGNFGDGISVVGGVGNEFRSNAIGGSPANGGNGITLSGDANDNQIGPDNFLVANASGIRIGTTAGGKNTIFRNSIFLNTNLGIDLADAGVTPNDNDGGVCNITTGCPSNNDQNYPTLSSAPYRAATALIPASQRVAGDLRSLVRSDPYRIEFYRSGSCSASGFGEGATYLDAIELTIGNSGFCSANNCTRAFNVAIDPGNVSIGDVITATATASNGDSSEFSACITVTASDLIFADGFE